MIITRFSRNFGALFLSDSVTLCLILVLSVGDRHFLTILLWYSVTHLSGNLLFNLILYSLALVHPHSVAWEPCYTLPWACCSTWLMEPQKLQPPAHPYTLILVLDDILASKQCHILSRAQNPSMEL